MSGAAVAAIMGATTGADVTPGAMDWTNTSGSYVATTNTVTVSGLGAPIVIALSWTGDLGAIYAYKNGAFLGAINNGNFGPIGTFDNTDTLYFYLYGAGLASSGTVTVTNQSAGTTLDTFTYSITAP